MIEVLNFSLENKVNIEFDRYIPINIEFGEWDISLNPTYYWRIGNFKDSLIEIGLSSNDGKIRSITLTQFSNMQLVRCDDKKDATKEVEECLPHFNISKFKNYHFDEKYDFDILLHNDCIDINISENMYFLKKVICDRVSFYINTNNCIYKIRIDNLIPSELEILTSY